MSPTRRPTRPTGRVVAKYTLLQLPEMAVLAGVLLLLHFWFDLPVWLMGLFFGLGLTLQALLFPFVWRSYDDRSQSYSYAMDDRTGLTIDRLDPAGRVRVRGEVWRAELCEPAQALEAGRAIRVCATRGLVLLVEPLSEDAPKDG